MRKWIVMMAFGWHMAQAADLPVLLEAAIETHPDVAAAQAAIEAAQRQTEAKAARLKPQAMLSLEQDYAWMKTDFARSSALLTGSWALWQPQVEAEVSASEATVMQRQADMAAVRQRLMWSVVSRWVRWQRLQASRRFEQQRIAVLEQLLAQMRESYGSGRGQLAKVALLARRKAEAQARLHQLDWELSQTEAAIEALSGRSDLDIVEPKPLAMIASVPESVEGHPALQALRAAVDAQLRAQRAQQARYSGKLDVFATAVRNDSGGRFYDDMEGVRVGIRYQRPLWTGGEIEAQAAQRAAQQRRLKARLSSLERDLHQQWRQAQAVLRAAGARETALEAALKASRMDEDANLALLRSGEVSVLTVLESALARYRLQRDITLNRWAAWLAHWQQQYATGKLRVQRKP